MFPDAAAAAESAQSVRFFRAPGSAMLLEVTSDIFTRITTAIRDAAQATGASFDYLLKTAQRESGMDPTAKAATSSAGGLFQFIDQTWLQTLKTAGPELGYQRYADAIEQTPSGRFTVADPAQRQAVMALRNDPTAASAMAGAFTKRNAATLAAKLGRQPTDGELYIAHFLGPAGASRFITAAQASPDARAADAFPNAAGANRSIFYDVRGKSRSLAQVYDVLVSKHERTRTPPIAPVLLAAMNAPKDGGSASMRARSADPAEPLLPMRSAYAAESGPVFHNLFHPEGRGAVSSLVSELWGAKSVQFPDRPRPPPRSDDAASAPAGKPLDLFRFLRSDTRPGGSA
jgi:hypothetical protein